MRSTFGKSLGIAVQGIMPEVYRNRPKADPANQSGQPWPESNAGNGETATTTGDPASHVFYLEGSGLAVVSVTITPDLDGYDPLTQGPLVYRLNAVISGGGPFPENNQLQATSASGFVQGVLLIPSTSGVIACGAGCTSYTPADYPSDASYPVSATFHLDLFRTT